MNAVAEPLHIELQTANPNDRVALRGVHLRARVAGMSLKATVEQTFVNLEDRAIEALYTFPLPDGAAVCGFEVVFFDKVFTGVVEEANRAIEKYDDAIAQGDGAYLLEQHRPDVFSVRVGNLKPRQAVTIRLTYVSDLQVVDRGIRLSFPTTIAPRYATTSGTDPIDAAIDGDALNPPHVLSVPYGLSMEMKIDLGKLLENVTSPSHGIRLSPSPGTPGEGRGEGLSRGPATVSLATSHSEMNRDLVLILNLTKEQTPFALASTSPQGENFIAVNFLPEFEELEGASKSTKSSETIFLLDCSGSMQGESIHQAMAALECCLRSMSAGDTFNICRFGSSFELFSPEPVIYSQEALNAALRFVRQGANLGGTEILAPLEAIFAQQLASGSIRNIVLLTDGQVTNEPAVIALAKRKRSRNRIFTFGIGTASSSFLVNGLARVTGGASEFIAPGERIEDKVLRTFGRLASPPVTDVEIDWGNIDAQIAPRNLPPLFDGDALRVFARLPGRIPENVTLRCNTASGPKSWTVEVRRGADPAQVLPTLWARSMIRTIEEEDGVQASASISGPSLDRSNLIELSKRYNVLCGLTSFIAVEHRSLEDRNEGNPALRRVPVALADDFLDLTHVLSEDGEYAVLLDEISPAPVRAVPIPSTPPAAPPLHKPRFFQRLRETLGGAMESKKMRRSQATFLGLADSKSAPVAASRSPASRDDLSNAGGDKLIDLLSRQNADGSFDSTPAYSDDNLDHRSALFIIDELLRNGRDAGEFQLVLRQTLLVLILLRMYFADRKETWNRASKKAMAFVHEKAGFSLDMVEGWLERVQSQLRVP